MAEKSSKTAKKKAIKETTFDNRSDIESRLLYNHRLFVDELLQNGHNAAKAYLKIYPKASKRHARTHASRLLAKKEVKDYYEELVREMLEADKTGLMERTLTELKGIAFQSPYEITILKSGIKARIFDAGKQRNTLKALELLAKYTKILSDSSGIKVEKMYVMNSEEYNAL